MTRSLIVIAFVAATWPVVARAEVMDKVIPPWNLGRLLVTAAVSLGCWWSGQRGQSLLRLAAVLLATLWVAFSVLIDDVWDPIVRSAMRVELGGVGLSIYMALSIMETILPAALLAHTLIARRRGTTRVSPYKR